MVVAPLLMPPQMQGGRRSVSCCRRHQPEVLRQLRHVQAGRRSRSAAPPVSDTSGLLPALSSTWGASGSSNTRPESGKAASCMVGCILCSGIQVQFLGRLLNKAAPTQRMPENKRYRSVNKFVAPFFADRFSNESVRIKFVAVFSVSPFYHSIFTSIKFNNGSKCYVSTC